MYKEQRGVTLVILVLTLVVISILISTTMISADKFLVTKKFINMENDIEILQEAIPVYYAKNHTLPVGNMISQDEANKFSEIKNINDNENYYKIDLSFLNDLQLNYGYGSDSKDYYVINEKSFAVYYLQGVNVNGVMRYTIDQTELSVDNIIESPNSFNIRVEPNISTVKVIGNTTSNNGIKGYKFRINNEEWTDLKTNGEYVFENLEPNKKYKVSMQAIDNFDNIIMAENNGLEFKTLAEE